MLEFNKKTTPSVLLSSRALVAMIALTLAGCDAEPPASDEPPGPAEPASFIARGPHAVGFRHVPAETTPQRTPPLSLWYPTAAEADDAITYTFAFKSPQLGEGDGTVEGHAVADAPIDPAKGPYPLVVLSHGFALNAAWYSHLSEHFASYGFIVAAPEHAEHDWFQNATSVIQRPIDIKHTIDYVTRASAPGGPFAGLVDLDHIAVVGHSFGGYTALAAAGARLDMDALNARCADIDETDPEAFLCLPLAGQQDTLAALAGLEVAPVGLWPSLGDPRVTATLPIAGDAYMFSDAGLAEVMAPLMAVGGTADTGTPWTWGPQPTFDAATSADKSLVGFVGAEHMFAVNTCDTMPWAAEGPLAEYLCEDPAWDRHEALDHLHHLTTAFLHHALLDDPAASRALSADIVAIPEIEYTTTIDE
ncbi:MAG: hypothetical protein B7733_10395 [Myxococcales bacterium FL481]|nr:MAG: hypothetical protein B7733_10395 [Myxococcales bacterium FL481]